MHWYLIHTKPRQEATALEHLTRQGYSCYLPRIKVEKISRSKLHIVTEPLFQRYLFIQLDQGTSAKSWAPIRSTRGVSRMVSFGQEPARIDSSLIATLQQHEARLHQTPQTLFAPGTRVHITAGAFTGIEGIYQLSDGEHRALILIEMLSKAARLAVPFASLHKVT